VSVGHDGAVAVGSVGHVNWYQNFKFGGTTTADVPSRALTRTTKGQVPAYILCYHDTWLLVAPRIRHQRMNHCLVRIELCEVYVRLD